RDVAGNAASTTASYAVAYDVRPLFDETKAVKSGSTVPIKLQLIDAASSNVSSPSIIVSTTQVVFVATTSATGAVDAGNANADANFRYDAALAGYIFNLSTKGLAVGTYRLDFTVAGDPTTHSVQFLVGK